MGRYTRMQIEAANAKALNAIARDHPDARAGRNILVSCCFHEDKHPSLSIDTELGRFKCFACGAYGGDAITYLQKRTGKGFVEVVESLIGGAQIEPIVRRTTPKEKKEQFDERKAQAIQRVWNEAEELFSKNPASIYLTVTRALSLAVMPSDLRCHPGLDYFDQEAREVVGTYPAMVAAIRNQAGEIVSVHRTFLTVDGRKAFGKQSKKLMGTPVHGITTGGAIRLYPAAEALGLTEGIETAIACQNDTGIPVWACVSTHGLETVVLPQEVKEVIIFADKDDAGMKAARKAAFRLRDEYGKTVKIIPPRQGDWADAENRRPRT